VPGIKRFVGLALLSLILYSGFIRCQLSTTFTFKEAFIPKNSIRRDIHSIKNIRIIQFLNWPIMKKELKRKYPMIESISLSFSSFPKINVEIEAKKPWVMIINENTPLVFSDDGVLLNKNLVDVELPNEKIMIVNSSVELIEHGKIKQGVLSTLHTISEGLLNLPLFKLQQILFSQDNIQVVESNGLIVNLGNSSDIQDKLVKLKYFLGKYRHNLDKMQLIDIQFSKRVIIKSKQ